MLLRRRVSSTRDSIDIAMMEEGTVGYLAAVQTLANEPK